MRVFVATDAWQPQINGVVRTLTSLAASLRDLGVDVDVLTPEGMRSVTLPGSSGLRVALPNPRRVAARIAAFAPDGIHIATDGPVGLATRWYCGRSRLPFTTSFHMRSADDMAARWPIPPRLNWRWRRWFHNAGRATMVATASAAAELAARRFTNVLRWPRGVDSRLFRPRRDASLGLLRPIFLTVGRLTTEKNIAAFLALDLPGTKVVVGEGPARDELARRCPNAVFLGARHGDDLARIYAAADVFVCPRRTDSVGLALLEALACGTPIAGFPVPATCDVVGEAPVAVLDENLRAACLHALALSREACRAFAEAMTWEESARCFLENVEHAGLVTSAVPTIAALRPAKVAYPAMTRTRRKASVPAAG